MDTLDGAIALAVSYGLQVSAEGVTVNEAGLDYRVFLTSDEAGLRWVLRIPRRTDVSEGMAAEARILALVAPVLAAEGVAVPDWQVRAPDLIAYPALPGAPGLTLTETGDVLWHMDPASPDYAARLGRLLACLHSLGATEAQAVGVEVRSPEQVRQVWRDDVARVSAEFAKR